jgi:GWxTD domain-containing protein
LECFVENALEEENPMNFRKAAGLVFIILLAAGCGIQLSPSKDPWFAQHYYIMQDFERAAYKSLSPAAKLEFQKLFWEVRTPISKQEFDKRMGYIADNFKKENSRQPWNTDRARVYLLNGKPAQVEYKQNDAWTMGIKEQAGGGGAAGIDDRTGEDVSANQAEEWTFRYKSFLVKYVFQFSRPNSYIMRQGGNIEGNRYLGELEIQNKLQTYGIVDEKQYREKLEALKAIIEEKK